MVAVTEAPRIALAGNPNSGKSTLFNAMTGARQRIGNWPGTTVERREGAASRNGLSIRFVDLPGAYSLCLDSPDHEIAVRTLLQEGVDAVVNVVDASNLERNLYLAVQLLEIGIPVVLALNMMDLARARGVSIDARRLSELLGAPVVPTVATRGVGIDSLVEEASQAGGETGFSNLDYGPKAEGILAEIRERLEGIRLPSKLRSRWLSLTVLEGNWALLEGLLDPGALEVLHEWASARESTWRDRLGDDPELAVAGRRYEFIHALVAATASGADEFAPAASDRVDRLLTHRVLGLPLFALVLFATFQSAFGLAAPVVAVLDAFLERFASVVGRALAAAQAPDWAVSLIRDGAIQGVGVVLTFIPNMAFLFLALTLLEDSGYLARAAFLMERLMARAGLPGNAVVPLILGFGCTVPAVMSTRLLGDRRARLATILVSPFMSCSARLPVYVFVAGALFPGRVGVAVFSLYALGAVVAFLSAMALRKTMLRGEPSPFVLELPAYKMPSPRTVASSALLKTRAFVRRAGANIVVAALAIWFLGAMPWGVTPGGEGSLIASIGRLLEPAFAPLGLGWREATAVIAGIGAKEIVVGTLAVLYGGSATAGATSGGGIAAAFSSAISPPAAAALMVFVLLYVPCVAAMATIRAETRSWRWPAAQALASFAIAWLIALATYRLALATGLS